MSFNLSMLEAPVVSGFRGREKELSLLRAADESPEVNIVTVLGLGGMGKSWLAKVFLDEAASNFADIVWVPLLNAPDWETTAKNIIRTLAPGASLDLGTPQEVLGLLYQRLQEARYLLVLDNFESLMKPHGSRAGELRPEHQGYEQLLKVLALGMAGLTVMTSREHPRTLDSLGNKVSTVQLVGLSVDEAGTLDARRQVEGTDAEWAQLVQLYGGNPQLLRLATATVVSLGGRLSSFLSQRSGQMAGERDLYAWHFDRLSERERSALYWLAVRRTPIPMHEVVARFFPPPAHGDSEALDVLTSLRARDIVEWSPPDVVSLQPALLEYVTHRLVQDMVHDLVGLRTGAGAAPTEHALLLTSSSASVRSSVRQLVLQPTLDQLALEVGGASELGIRLRAYLDRLRDDPLGKQGYGAGNVCNLLATHEAEIRDLDLSSLVVRQANLSDSRLIGSSLAHAELVECDTAQTFGNILTVAASPDGEWFAAAGTDNDVRVWTHQGLQHATFIGHTNWVRSMAFDAAGSLLATTSSDGTLRVWDVRRRSLEWSVEAHGMRVWSLAWAGDAVVTASQDGTLRAWRADTGQPVAEMVGHTAPVLAVATLAECLVASGSADGTVRFWSLEDGAEVSRFDCGFEARALAATADTVLVGGDTGRIILVTHIEGEGTTATPLRDEGSPVNAIAISPDRSWAATAHDDGSILIWDLPRRHLLSQLGGHASRTTSLAFGAGEYLLSGGEDQRVCRWDTSRWQLQDVLVGKANHAWSVALSRAPGLPDEGPLLVSAHEDAALRVWREQSAGWTLAQELRGHTNRIWSVRTSRSRPQAVTASEDGFARVWDLATGQAAAVLGDHLSAVWAADFTRDGKAVITGTHDGKLRVWDVETGRVRAQVTGHQKRIRAVECHPQEDLVVSGAEDFVIRAWTSDLEPLASLNGHEDRINALSFSQDGSILTSGGRDGQVIVWDFESREPLTAITAPVFVWAVATSPTGDTVAFGLENGEVRTFDRHTQAESGPICQHDHRVKSLTFSDDGRLLFSCSEEGAIRVLDLAHGSVDAEMHAPRSYEGLDITGVQGLSAAGLATLEILGARRREDGSALAGPKTVAPTPGGPPKHVFISYSRQDEEYAARLTAALDRAGVPVWRDTDRVEHGSAFVEDLQKAIEGSAAVIALMSPHAAASRWVRRELQHADSAGVTILPLLLDGSPLFQLGDLHFENVRHGQLPGASFFSRLRQLS